jgi:hypothetical protein
MDTQDLDLDGEASVGGRTYRMIASEDTRA